MVSKHSLSERSFRASYLEMSKYGRSTLITHTPMYFFGVLQVQGAGRWGWHWIGFISLLLVCFYRLTLCWKIESIMSRPGGPRRWGTLFGLGNTALALCWGISGVLMVLEHGYTMPAMTMILLITGIGASWVGAYAFDFGWTTAGYLLLFMPMGVTMFFVPGAIPMAIAALCMVFCYYLMAKTMHRGRVELLRGNEIIETQREALQAAHSDLKQAHDTVRGMLSSLSEAFLILDLDGFCTNNPSEHAKDLLGLDPTGRYLTDILKLDPAARESCRKWFKLLTSDQMEFAEIALLGPKIIEDHAKARVLAFRYSPMRDDQGKLVSVILTAVDITEEHRAKRQAEEAREKAQLILKIQENAPAFRIFLADFDSKLAGLSTWDGRDSPTMRRELHTLKSAAALFGVNSISRAVHGVELEIRKWSGNTEGDDPAFRDFVRLAVSQLYQEFSLWQKSRAALFAQLGLLEQEELSLSRDQLAELEAEYRGDPVRLDVFRQLIQRANSRTLREILRGYGGHVQSTAEKLGKKVTYQIDSSAGEVALPPGTYREVFRSLVHIFNNAIDHGIEYPAERRLAGKPDGGTIRVVYDRTQAEGRSWLRIGIEDNGAGIDVARLRRLLEERGIPNAGASDLETMHHIFDDGLSTRSEVTETSGQGVGMGAVRAAVENARGRIRITRSDKSGTRFEILLPDRSLPEVQRNAPIPAA